MVSGQIEGMVPNRPKCKGPITDEFGKTSFAPSFETGQDDGGVGGILPQLESLLQFPAIVQSSIQDKHVALAILGW
jgi:hypothetical protein